MSKRRKHEYQWHDGFFRFVVNRDDGCVADLAKLAEQYGGMNELSELFALVDWERSEQVTDAFFDKGGGRITFADLVYRLYLVGTDFYFYLLAEHKDMIRGGYRPYLQTDGYAMRIRERDKGSLVLSLLLIGSEDAPKHSSYIDAVLASRDVPERVVAVLRRCRQVFDTHLSLGVALQRVPDEVILDGKSFICPATIYVIKHNKRLIRERIAMLLRLCREMKAQGKDVVVGGILWYGINASGMSEEEWLAIEVADCPHLPKEELVMFKREFGLETVEREIAESKAEGIQQGKAEGIQQGKAEGIQQGKAEGKLAERRDIAISMLKQGLPEATISSTTKLSRKEVRLLKRSL